jgi:hypothetical protein
LHPEIPCLLGTEFPSAISRGSQRPGCDDSTAKRWLRGKSRVPGQAVYAVLADIFARID